MKKSKRFVIIRTGLIDENGNAFAFLFPKKCNPKKYFNKKYKEYLIDLFVKCPKIKVVYKK